jgi:hypothetical protein
VITNTELIRRDLAATNHDIVSPETRAKSRKADHETAEENSLEDQTQGEACESYPRKKRSLHRRGHPRRDWGGYAALEGGKAAK